MWQQYITIQNNQICLYKIANKQNVKVKSTARSTSKKLMYAVAVHKRKQLQLNQKYIYILQDQNNTNCLYVLSKIYIPRNYITQSL